MNGIRTKGKFSSKFFSVFASTLANIPTIWYLAYNEGIWGLGVTKLNFVQKESYILEIPSFFSTQKPQKSGMDKHRR